MVESGGYNLRVLTGDTSCAADPWMPRSAQILGGNRKREQTPDVRGGAHVTPPALLTLAPLLSGVLGTGSDAKACQLYASPASTPCNDTKSGDGRARQKKVCGHRQS